MSTWQSVSKMKVTPTREWHIVLTRGLAPKATLEMLAVMWRNGGPRTPPRKRSNGRTYGNSMARNKRTKTHRTGTRFLLFLIKMVAKSSLEERVTWRQELTRGHGRVLLPGVFLRACLGCKLRES